MESLLIRIFRIVRPIPIHNLYILSLLWVAARDGVPVRYRPVSDGNSTWAQLGFLTTVVSTTSDALMT